MSFEVEPSLSQRTSRRTIVRTGARLAYAAPLVAASTRLTAGLTRAEGASFPACTGVYELINGGCFETVLHADFRECSHFECEVTGGVDGSENFLCFTPLATTPCHTNSDCPSGQACLPGWDWCIAPC